MKYRGPLSILKDDHPALRIPSEPIVEVTEDIKGLAIEMAKVLALAPAIGISAPQIGKHIQLIIIDTRNITPSGEFYIILNPEILHEEGQAIYKEGCLSFPGKILKIKRSRKVKIKYLTLNGNYEIIELDNWEARVFQHEYDHLKGKVFTEYDR